MDNIISIVNRGIDIMVLFLNQDGQLSYVIFDGENVIEDTWSGM